MSKEREIKFRAWDGDDEVMICPNHVARDGRAYYKVHSIPTYSDIVMQYTGLKDKNGKEIFEGDIVRHRNGAHAVEYNEGSYSFQMGLSSAVLDQEVSPDDNIEVIGNIYENPELRRKIT